MSDEVEMVEVYKSGRKAGLPVRCECGGRILYEFSFGLTFSCCDTCTPVVPWPAKLTNPRPAAG